MDAIHEPKILMAVLQDHATAFADLQRALSRLTFLLELQLGLSRGELNVRQVDRQLAADDFSPRCLE